MAPATPFAAVDAGIGSRQTRSEWNHLAVLVRQRFRMRVESQMAGVGNAELDALHRDVYANNMAPYWVVDRSVAHDEDRQVMQGRKAVPFTWKYERQIEPLLQRSAALIQTETSERRSLSLLTPG